MRAVKMAILALAALTLLAALVARAYTPILLAPPDAASTAMRQVSARANDVELSMHLPAGPYFLGELLPVSVSLTNHSSQAVAVFGAPTPNPCSVALFVLSSGGTPSFTLDPATTHSSLPMGRR